MLSSAGPLRAPARAVPPRRGSCRGAPRASSSPAAPAAVELACRVAVRVPFGATVRVAGGCSELGGWAPAAGPALAWSHGHIWRATLPTVPAGTPFKFVIVHPDGAAEFEAGDNRVAGEGGPHDTFRGRDPPAPEAAAGAAATPPPEPTQQQQQQQQRPAPAPPPPPQQPALAGRGVAPPPPGRAPAAAPPVPAPVAAAATSLARRDASAASWLQKLAAAEAEVSSPPAPGDASSVPVALLAVYLQLVSTGVLPCAEAGGHSRPSRNAAVGRSLFARLDAGLTADSTSPPAAAASSPAPTPPELLLLATRAALPWLPSFSGEFTQAVPLTRIRDIAHRNDIPRDLKLEIKTTIQNKLHRCAGPEDLVATESVLARVLADEGAYSPGFVSELKLFAAELRDFFNASSAFDRLAALRPGLGGEAGAAVDGLMAARAAVEAADAAAAGGGGAAAAPPPSRAPAAQLIAALGAAAGARRALGAALAASPAAAAGDKGGGSGDDPLVRRQALRAADHGLEGYAFVLASRLAGWAEATAPPGGVAPPPEWFLATLAAAAAAAAHPGLSGFRPAECAAAGAGLAACARPAEAAQLSARLAAGGAADGAAGDEPLLRILAAAQRGVRLAGDAAAAMAAAFGSPAAALGAAFPATSAAATACAFYAEAAVRASPAFPLASLCSLLAAAARAPLPGGSDALEPLLPGAATGVLTRRPALAGCGDLTSEESGGGGLRLPAVLLVSSADGDEELAGAGVCALLLLGQQLPHLSHLAIRARQEGVVLGATGRSDHPLAMADGGPAEGLLGAAVTLTLGHDGAASLRRATRAEAEAAAAAAAGGAGLRAAAAAAGEAAVAAAGAAGAGGPAPAAAPAAAAPGGGDGPPPVPLAGCAASACGAKAAACGRLVSLAEASGGLFTAPGGCVLPFGSLEAAVAALGAADAAAHAAALARLETAPAGPPLDAAVAEVAEVVGRARPGAAALAALRSLVQAAAAAAAPPPSPASAAAAAAAPLLLAVRSSASVEDLAGFSAAGLYDSVTGVPAAEGGDAALGAAVAAVWASLHSRRAVLARRAAGLPQAEARMAVLVQPLAAVATAFVLHTKAPGFSPAAAAASAAAAQPPPLLAELCAGLGDTLASGDRGSGWRLLVAPAVAPALAPAGGAPPAAAAPGAVTALSFANFSVARGGGGGGAGGDAVVDYSAEPLSAADGAARSAAARRLAAVGWALQAAAGGVPQDVEGGLLAGGGGGGGGEGGGGVVVVQTRPQPDSA